MIEMPLVLAEASTLALVALASGAIALGATLAGRKKVRVGDNDDPLEEPATSFAERNAAIPTLYGRRRIGVHFTSVWYRVSVEEKVGPSGGGGKGLFGSGGGGGSAQTVWFEDAIQCISSTADTLFGVYQSGNPIFESSSGVSPDGNGEYALDLGDDGAATLHFGIVGAPVRVVSRQQGTGDVISRSRWESLCAIEWHRLRLGASPTWKQWEFELGSYPTANRLSDSAYLVRPTGSDAGDEGINAAHFIYQILTLPFPYGLNLDPDLIDKPSLEDVGEVCETEGLGVNALITVSIKSVLEDVMNMCDITMSERDGTLYFDILREVTINPPSLFGTVLTDDVPESAASLEESTPTRATLQFRNKDLAFDRDSSSVTDDGNADRSGGYKTINLNTDLFTELTMIESILGRKNQHGFGDKQTLTVRGTRGALVLAAGEAVSVEAFGGSRIVGIQHDLRNDLVSLEVMLDAFNVPSVSIDLPDWAAGLYRVAEPDIAFNWFELPPEDAQGKFGVGVVRLRKHIGIIGANIFAANSSGVYRNIGAQNSGAFGGQIETAIDSSDDSPIVSGPIFEATDFEDESIEDLTGDNDAWRGGFNLCVINREVFFIRKLTRQTVPTWAASTAYAVDDEVVPSGDPTGLRYVCTVAGTSGASEPEWPLRPEASTFTDGGVTWEPRHFRYQIEQMIRARYQTTVGNHSIGDYCFVIPRTSLNNVINPVFATGTTLCIKTQPFTRSDIVDLADVTEVCNIFTGVGDPTIILVDEETNIIVTHTGATLKLGVET